MLQVLSTPACPLMWQHVRPAACCTQAMPPSPPAGHSGLRCSPHIPCNRPRPPRHACPSPRPNRRLTMAQARVGYIPHARAVPPNTSRCTQGPCADGLVSALVCVTRAHKRSRTTPARHTAWCWRSEHQSRQGGGASARPLAWSVQVHVALLCHADVAGTKTHACSMTTSAAVTKPHSRMLWQQQGYPHWHEHPAEGCSARRGAMLYCCTQAGRQELWCGTRARTWAGGRDITAQGSREPAPSVLV